MKGERLCIFTRFPVAGEAKTRLIPALGADGAAALQREMTEHTVRQARHAGAEIEIRYTGGSEQQMRTWLGDDLCYAAQGDGHLGERMARTFQQHFASGGDRVVIIGGDCPSNHRKNIQTAFHWLENNNCVIGPASDGGYYLIGLTRPMPELFQGLEWGAERVLEQTLAAAPCKPALLPELHDVDLPEDIPDIISVIIPTLNEAENIFQTLKKVNEGFRVECIVSDGGSVDGTADMVCRFSHFVKCENKGRAAQMNTGASKASGGILLFLHADTELPDNWDFLIRAALRDPSVALGAFRFGVRERLRGIGVVEWGTNIRSRLLRMPYGDQGLFLRKEMCERIGGFPEQPILEDVELVRRARKIGKVVTLRETALTSGRRWQQLGVVRTTLRNQLILCAAFFGVSPGTLRRIYG